VFPWISCLFSNGKRALLLDRNLEQNKVFVHFERRNAFWLRMAHYLSALKYVSLLMCVLSSSCSSTSLCSRSSEQKVCLFYI
jgi:hypothetical protein